MQDLSVYYCPVCGRYSYSQPSGLPACSLCEVSMIFLMPYSDFHFLNQEERDKFLIQKMMESDASLSGRLLAYLRSCSCKEAATLIDPRINQRASENPNRNAPIQWMPLTSWDLLHQTRHLEHQLEKYLTDCPAKQDPELTPPT